MVSSITTVVTSRLVASELDSQTFSNETKGLFPAQCILMAPLKVSTTSQLLGGLFAPGRVTQGKQALGD